MTDLERDVCAVIIGKGPKLFEFNALVLACVASSEFAAAPRSVSTSFVVVVAVWSLVLIVLLIVDDAVSDSFDVLQLLTLLP